MKKKIMNNIINQIGAQIMNTRNAEIKRNKKIALYGITGVVVLFAVLCITACYTPSPLYGTWADNRGSKITFTADGNYNATVIDTAGTSTTYSGTWSVIDNVLVFTKESGSTIDTEWDIRGAMLYLDWTDDEGASQSLTLYHISN